MPSQPGFVAPTAPKRAQVRRARVDFMGARGSKAVSTAIAARIFSVQVPQGSRSAGNAPPLAVWGRGVRSRYWWCVLHPWAWHRPVRQTRRAGGYTTKHVPPLQTDALHSIPCLSVRRHTAHWRTMPWRAGGRWATGSALQGVGWDQHGGFYPGVAVGNGGAGSAVRSGEGEGDELCVHFLRSVSCASLGRLAAV